MANIFTNSPATLDFEENDLTDADAAHTSGTGSVAASSTQAKGTYSARCYTTSGASGDVAYVRKQTSWPAGDVAFVRWFVYVDSHGSPFVGADAIVLGGLIQYQSLNNNRCCVLRLEDDASLALYATDNGGESQYGSNHSINLDQWYEVELKYDISGTDMVAEMWIDGVSRASGTGSGVPTFNPANLCVGVGVANWNVNNYADVYVDDIQAEDARIGGGGIAHLMRRQPIHSRVNVYALRI